MDLLQWYLNITLIREVRSIKSSVKQLGFTIQDNGTEQGRVISATRFSLFKATGRIIAILLRWDNLKHGWCQASIQRTQQRPQTLQHHEKWEQEETTHFTTSTVKYSKLWHHLFLQILTGLGPFFGKYFRPRAHKNHSRQAAWAGANTYCSARSMLCNRSLVASLKSNNNNTYQSTNFS